MINYKKMIPYPYGRLQASYDAASWNLIGKTTLEDIDKLVIFYKREVVHSKYVSRTIVRLDTLCKKMHRTRALFLDIVMSIMWSEYAFSKKYHRKPVLTNIVYSIDGMGHMWLEEMPGVFSAFYHIELRKLA